MNQCAVKYYYAYSRQTFPDGVRHYHQFSTDKDSLDCEALYVTSITTEYPGKLFQLVEQYAKKHLDEYLCIENDHVMKEYNTEELVPCPYCVGLCAKIGVALDFGCEVCHGSGEITIGESF